MPKRSVTPRGFAIYGELADKYGSKVRVQKSSLATDDYVWIFASHERPKLSPDQVELLAAAGFGTPVRLDELAAMLTPSPHLDVEQAIRVRDALDAFIAGHSEAPAPGLSTGDPVDRLWGDGGPAGKVAVMAANGLHRGGMATIADLLKCDARDLTDIRALGAGCLDEVRRVLAVHGLTLRGEGAGDD